MHVQGGESNWEEMCLSFTYYYPRTNLNFCFTSPSDKEFLSFVQETVRYIFKRCTGSHSNSKCTCLLCSPPNRTSVLETSNNAFLFGAEGVKEALHSIEWTPEAVHSLESSLSNSEVSILCSGDSEGGFVSYLK